MRPNSQGWEIHISECPLTLCTTFHPRAATQKLCDKPFCQGTQSVGQKWPWTGFSAWMVGRCVKWMTGSILCSQDFPLPFHLWICPQTQYFLKEAKYYVSQELCFLFHSHDTPYWKVLHIHTHSHSHSLICQANQHQQTKFQIPP